jgi:hypothetical protein
MCDNLSVSVDFCPLFHVADVVVSSFVYAADITLEIVALHTPYVAVFVTDARSAHQWVFKSGKSPIF